MTPHKVIGLGVFLHPCLYIFSKSTSSRQTATTSTMSNTVCTPLFISTHQVKIVKGQRWCEERKRLLFLRFLKISSPQRHFSRPTSSLPLDWCILVRSHHLEAVNSSFERQVSHSTLHATFARLFAAQLFVVTRPKAHFRSLIHSKSFDQQSSKGAKHGLPSDHCNMIQSIILDSRIHFMVGAV